MSNRTLDSDSKSLLEFRRRLGDPVSSLISPASCLGPPLHLKAWYDSLPVLQIFLAQPPHAWVGTVCVTPNRTLWTGVTCTDGRVTKLELTQFKNLLSGEMQRWTTLCHVAGVILAPQYPMLSV